MSLRVWWGTLKWIGTDSSVLFCIPRLCFPKRSLRVRPVCPIYCEGRVMSVFKLLYIHNSNDSLYFRCPDAERFYPFEILALRTLKL